MNFKRYLGAALALCALVMASAAMAQTVPNAVAPQVNSVPTQAQCNGRLGSPCYQVAGVILTDGAVNRSGTIAAGGTAQDLMPANSARLGWEFQNQSQSDTCYIRSKGSLGTTVATADQNSLAIYPGQYFSPAHVTGYGLSIYCGLTGTPYYAREW